MGEWDDPEAFPWCVWSEQEEILLYWGEDAGFDKARFCTLRMNGQYRGDLLVGYCITYVQ